MFLAGSPSRRLILLFMTTLTLLASVSVIAHTGPTLDQQRNHYLEALAAIRSHDSATLARLLPGLEDYPLYPYLSYEYLRRQLDSVDPDQVRRFLEDWGDSPVGNRLRSDWLGHLREQDRWRDFLAFYPPDGSRNTVHACYYHEGLVRAGRADEAFAGALELWTVGRSQPNDCDPLFEHLIERDLIDADTAWRRLQLALDNNGIALARYIMRFLDTDTQRRAADAQITIAANSGRISDYEAVARIPWPEREHTIRRALAHLARTDAPAALRHWEHFSSAPQISTATRTAVLGPLVRGHHQQNRGDIGDRVLRDNLELAEASLLEWRLREAIRAADWPTVLTWIERLPEELQRHERWQYWHVRAAELKGEPLPNADGILAALAPRRSFYGFVASQRLGLPYTMEHSPAVPPAEAVNRVRSDDAILRARELLHFGEFVDARREWNHAGRQFSEAEWIAAAHLATEWERYQFAINAMIAAGYWDDIELRFPLAWHDAFTEAARRYGMPRVSLMAIARQESAFGTDVVSPAGARGLMQIMPATARETAARVGLSGYRADQLFDPDVNLQLGSHYYHQLLERFDNNRILAAAGYNAGPGRVRGWRQRTGGELPVDAWIESIPFAETRQYVQNVLSFSVIYAHRLGEEIDMLTPAELDTRL